MQQMISDPSSIKSIKIVKLNEPVKTRRKFRVINTKSSDLKDSDRDRQEAVNNQESLSQVALVNSTEPTESTEVISDIDIINDILTRQTANLSNLTDPTNTFVQDTQDNEVNARDIQDIIFNLINNIKTNCKKIKKDTNELERCFS